MANILDNKTQLQTLLSTLSRKGINSTVTSLNNKSGDVTTEVTDLDVTVETWTFELEDGTSVDKTMVFYSPKGLINFTIKWDNDGLKTYQAEAGMTWRQWIESDYSDNTWHFNSDSDCPRGEGDGGYVRDVVITDVILANHQYSGFQMWEDGL